MLTKSRYNILVPLLRQRMLAYNAFTGALAIWDREDVSAYDGCLTAERSTDDPLIIGLLRAGFLVPTSVDERELLRQQYEEARGDPRSLILTIAPTLMCNFACDYCFQGADKPSGTMSLDVQNAIVRLVSKAAGTGKRIGVTWYGGEPLLAKDVISGLSRRILAVATNAGVRLDGSIVTNGYGLTSAVA